MSAFNQRARVSHIRINTSASRRRRCCCRKVRATSNPSGSYVNEGEVPAGVKGSVGNTKLKTFVVDCRTDEQVARTGERRFFFFVTANTLHTHCNSTLVQFVDTTI
jgi:hypothetical protein